MPAKPQKGKKGDGKKWFDEEVYYKPPYKMERFHDHVGKTPVDPLTGEVTKESLFNDPTESGDYKQSWWPTEIIVEDTFDCMGTAEDVSKVMNWDNIVFSNPNTWVVFQEGERIPRQKKVGDFQFQANYQEPLAEKPSGEDPDPKGWWEYVRTHLKRKTVSCAGHYCTLAYKEGEFWRECSNQCGTWVNDQVSFGPAHSGREDMCSCRFRMRFVGNAHFIFVFGPLLTVMFPSVYRQVIQCLYNGTVAAHFQKFPDAVVPKWNHPPPYSQKFVYQFALIYLLGSVWTYATATSLLSWVLTLVFGDVCLFSACALRFLFIAAYVSWIIFHDLVPEANKGIDKSRWEAAFNTYCKQVGACNIGEGEVVTPDTKLRCGPAEIDPKTRKVTAIANRYPACFRRLLGIPEEAPKRK